MMRGPPAVVVILPKFAIAERRVRIAKVDGVEHVEHFDPDFDVLAVTDTEIPRQCEIHVPEAGTAKEPFRRVAPEPGVFGANAPILNHWFSSGLVDGRIADDERPLIPQTGE